MNWFTRPIAARLAFFVVALALIRCIGECFRLRYITGPSLPFERLVPFLLGAALCSLCLVSIFIAYFYNRYRLSVWLALACVAGMLYLKYLFHV